MKTMGVYEVVGKLAFRGHAPGTVFADRIAPTVERRRVAAGHLRLLERVPMDLPAGLYQLPKGWA